jgi:hypothetical protein
MRPGLDISRDAHRACLASVGLAAILVAYDKTVVTTASPGGRSGTLNGSFAIYDAGRRLSELCRSPAHRFELAR